MAIVTPPALPVGTGSPEAWRAVEAKLGTELPADYKEFIDTYGIGEFYRFLGVGAPFAGTNPFDRHFQWLEFFRCQEEFPLFPQPGGLLYVGGDENGNLLFWLTRGDPSDWTMVYFTDDYLDFETYEMSLTQFLAGWLSGQVRPAFLEDAHVLDRDEPIFKAYSPRE